MEYRIKRSRGATRVRETAPKYGGGEPRPQPLGFKVTVADRGRMVLPAEVRDRLKIKDGDWLTLILEPNGVIKMLTGEVYANSLVGMFKHLKRPDQSMVGELIAERRREAAMEEREIQEFLARRRVKTRR